MNGPRNDRPVDASRAPALRLAAALLLGGSLHFLAPRFFDRIIPRRLPGEPRAYTYAFGVAALGIGTGLSIARTRRFSATLAGAFFVAVMPAKVQLTVSWWRDETKRLPAKVTAVVQLFWQVPLVTEAWRARRNAANRRRHGSPPRGVEPCGLRWTRTFPRCSSPLQVQERGRGRHGRESRQHR